VAAAVEPNPFFESQMVEPAAATFGKDASLLVAVDAEDDWAGCMPVHRGI